MSGWEAWTWLTMMVFQTIGLKSSGSTRWGANLKIVLLSRWVKHWAYCNMFVLNCLSCVCRYISKTNKISKSMFLLGLHTYLSGYRQIVRCHDRPVTQCSAHHHSDIHGSSGTWWNFSMPKPAIKYCRWRNKSICNLFKKFQRYQENSKILSVAGQLLAIIIFLWNCTFLVCSLHC